MCIAFARQFNHDYGWLVTCYIWIESLKGCHFLTYCYVYVIFLYFIGMDFSHDYDGTNELLVAGSRERLQACKCVILAFGDLGYTDPPIPDISDALGEYTDSDGMEALKSKIHEILILSQVVRDDEILSLDVTSLQGDDHFTVSLQLVFGSETFNLPIIR